MSDDDLRYIKEKHLADVLEDLMATLVREKPSDIMLATKAWCDRKASGSTTLKKLAPTIEVENSLRPDAGVKQTNSMGPVAAAPAPVPAPTPAPAPVPVKVFNPVPIAKEPLNAKQVTEEDDDDKKNYVPPSPKNRAAPQRTFSQINKERPNINLKPKEKKEKTGGGDDDDMSSLIEN